MKRISVPAQALAALLAAAVLNAGCENQAPTETALLTPEEAAAAARKPAQGYQYSVLHFPGATWTRAYRMNTRGDVVGIKVDQDGMHGFLRRGDRYEDITYPDAVMTHPYGINERGDIVGNYMPESGVNRGFMLSRGRFTELNVPGANGTVLWDINARGEISGEYQAVPGGPWHAFTWRNGEFAFLAIPDGTMSAGFGINNDGDVVGHYRLPAAGGGVTKMFGFIWRNGEVTHLDYPVPNAMSCAMGISMHAVVGHYQDSSNNIVYGYVWQDGAFTATLRVPEAAQTFPTSITPSGAIAGYHWDAAANNWRGFVATPQNQAGR
jgi:hypothetical protein